MRPDEHKKKKSAQYQKKHGGASAKDVKGESEKGSSKSRKPPFSRSEKTPQTSRSDTQKKVDSSTSESEDDGKGADVQSKSFRRREISSNWAKYNLPPVEADDSVTSPKGQDFSKLLHSAGGALAHFRFKDEESWGEDEGDVADTGTQVLSLDCADLATSLGCLPLYTQLRLETDIFTAEQVSAMDKTADQNRQLAGLPALDQPKLHSNQQTHAETKLSETSTTSNTPGQETGVKSLSPSSNDVATSEHCKAEHREDSSQKAAVVVSSVGFSDADLDSLLESGDGEDKVCGQAGVAGSVQGVSADCDTVTEQDLDDILAMESPLSSQSGTSTAHQAMKESNTATESAELEDWLDSVLDD